MLRLTKGSVSGRWDGYDWGLMLNVDDLLPRRLPHRVCAVPAVLNRSGIVASDAPDILADASLGSLKAYEEAGSIPQAFVPAGPRAESATRASYLRA